MAAPVAGVGLWHGKIRSLGTPLQPQGLKIDFVCLKNWLRGQDSNLRPAG